MLDNYEKNADGVIHQKRIVNSMQVYDKHYVDTRYNTYDEKRMQMAYYRLGFILGQIGEVPNSILDVGYGNGDFLKASSTIMNRCYGNDVSNYPLPDKVEFVTNITAQHFNVITFFDALEHFEDIEFVKELDCDYLVVSLPWCHYFSDEWFDQWKHRRPDEHLWHFDDASLVRFADRMGYDLVSITNMEDAIRVDPVAKSEGYSNILTGVFRKRSGQ